jgi:predicted ATPase
MPHDLPVPLTSLIGRSRELDAIGETLRTTRLVTLAGPGGVGKTRLAVEVAHRETARRRDGVWIVDLMSSPNAPDVAAETARALDVRGASGVAPTDALRRFLTERDALLVLDNCEHVIVACARLATDLLTSCGELRILATTFRGRTHRPVGPPRRARRQPCVPRRASAPSRPPSRDR